MVQNKSYVMSSDLLISNDLRKQLQSIYEIQFDYKKTIEATIGQTLQSITEMQERMLQENLRPILNIIEKQQATYRKLAAFSTPANIQVPKSTVLAFQEALNTLPRVEIPQEQIIQSLERVEACLESNVIGAEDTEEILKESAQLRTFIPEWSDTHEKISGIVANDESARVLAYLLCLYLFIAIFQPNFVLDVAIEEFFRHVLISKGETYMIRKIKRK